MEHHLILRVVTRVLVAPILLFGLYVHFHADFGAGGGFQAGVILAVAFILYGIVFGLNRLRSIFPDRWVIRILAFGLLLYASVGIASLFLGSNYLDYTPLLPTPKDAQHYGIIAIELGVLTTVFGVMMAIYYGFSGRPPSLNDSDW